MPTVLKGLSIRDSFAIEALGFLIQKYESNSIPIPDIVSRAYAYASGMLTEANTQGASDTDYNIGKILTDGFADLVTAIGQGGGGGGGTSGVIHIGDDTHGVGETSSYPLHISSTGELSIKNAQSGTPAQDVPIIIAGKSGGVAIPISHASGDSVGIAGTQSSGTDYTNALKVAIVYGGGSGGSTDVSDIVDALINDNGITGETYTALATSLANTVKALNAGSTNLNDNVVNQLSLIKTAITNIGKLNKDDVIAYSNTSYIDYIVAFINENNYKYPVKVTPANIASLLQNTYDTRYDRLAIASPIQTAGGIPNKLSADTIYPFGYAIGGQNNNPNIKLPDVLGASRVIRIGLWFYTVENPGLASISVSFSNDESIGVIYQGDKNDNSNLLAADTYYYCEAKYIGVWIVSFTPYGIAPH